MIPADMEAANSVPHYEQLRDERITRNKIEVALRLREAGFQDQDFCNSLFPTARAGSSIKSSSAPALNRDRGRQQSEEFNSVPRRSTRRRPTPQVTPSEAPPTNLKALVSLPPVSEFEFSFVFSPIALSDSRNPRPRVLVGLTLNCLPMFTDP